MNDKSSESIVRFVWHEEKSRLNTLKHNVSFDLAIRVWNDPMYTVFLGYPVDGEQRWNAIGRVGDVTLLVVVHTYRGYDDEEVRIISARKATSHERKRYEQEAL